MAFTNEWRSLREVLPRVHASLDEWTINQTPQYITPVESIHVGKSGLCLVRFSVVAGSVDFTSLMSGWLPRTVLMTISVKNVSEFRVSCDSRICSTYFSLPDIDPAAFATRREQDLCIHVSQLRRVLGVDMLGSVFTRLRQLQTEQPQPAPKPTFFNAATGLWEHFSYTKKVMNENGEAGLRPSFAFPRVLSPRSLTLM